MRAAAAPVAPMLCTAKTAGRWLPAATTTAQQGWGRPPPDGRPPLDGSLELANGGQVEHELSARRGAVLGAQVAAH